MLRTLPTAGRHDGAWPGSPADRRANADVNVRVAPDHRPRVTRSGGELLVSLARPDYLSGISLTVAIPVAAAGRWALNLFSEVGQALAQAEHADTTK